MRKKLIEENPKMAAEWDSDKNIGLNIDEFTGGSNKKVWWKCKLGHSWYAEINKRFTAGRNCPYCSGNKVWIGFNDLVTTNPLIASEWDYEKNGEFRPEQFSAGADIKIWWKCNKCNYSWKALLYSRKKHGCPSCAGNIFTFGINDLQTLNPKLALEWDNERNGDLKPKDIAVNCNKKAWWICKLGHSWQTQISTRNSGRGCPYCTNRKLLSGFNDLLTVDPELANEWNYEKNGSLLPEDVLNGTHKSVWWLCSSGHSWQAKVSQRRRGCGCPYDSGKLVLQGETDFKTQYPIICKEWDYEKNGIVNPETIARYSHKLYWWKCHKGHSYQSSTSNRIKGSGCPYCVGKRPIIGETDFRTVHPELICEWDFEKNTPLLPEHVTFGSDKKIWWQCEKGHSFNASIYSRHTKRGCPYCARFKNRHPVIVGLTDLATKYPTIAAQWDHERNDGLKPQEVLPHSTRMVWWVCKHGHHWKTKVQSRVKGTLCPKCKGKTPMSTRFI